MSEPAPPPSPVALPTWRDRLDLISSSSGLSPAQVAMVAAGVAVALVAGWLLLRQPAGPPPEDSMPRAGGRGSASPAVTSTTAPETVIVYAAGAVRRPGVFTLPAGSRVKDLVDAAGGAMPNADLERINLAAPLVDGSQVFVPRQGEPVPAAVGAGSPGDASTPAGPVDLNTATLDQLDALPGVGPATAKAILAERDKRGRFSSVEDLLDVRGIGPAKLDALRDLVTV